MDDESVSIVKQTMNKVTLQALRAFRSGAISEEVYTSSVAADGDKQRWSNFLYRFLSRYVNASNEEDLSEGLDKIVALMDQSTREELCWNTLQKSKGLHPRMFGMLYKHCKFLFYRDLPDDAHITIAIPTYNRDARLNASLRHLLSYRLDCLSIYIRDNASSDNTKEIVATVQRDFPGASVVYTANTTNVGWLRNYLVTLSSHEYDFCIVGSDDDLIPEEMIAYSLWFYLLYPEYGLLYFDKRKHLRPLYPGTGSLFGSRPSDESLSIVKSVNTFGGMVINGDAFKKCSSSFYAEKSLMGHFGFALAVSQQYPVASISVDRFDPVINKFAFLGSTSGINTSLNWDNISAMIDDGSLDHSFYINGFVRQSFGCILYSIAYNASSPSITDAALAIQYLSYVNPWWQAWVGHRVRTFSLDKPGSKSYLITSLRLLRPQYIHNPFILSDLAVVFDARHSELPKDLHSLFNAIICLVMRLKVHIRHGYDARSCPCSVFHCIGSLGELVRRGLSVDEAITIAEEYLTSHHFAILNCDPGPTKSIQSIIGAPHYGSGYHQDVFASSVDLMLNKDSSRIQGLLASNENCSVGLRAGRAHTPRDISGLINSMLEDVRGIIGKLLSDE